MIDTSNTPSALLTNNLLTKTTEKSPNVSFLATSRYNIKIAPTTANQLLTSSTVDINGPTIRSEPGDYDVVYGRGKGFYNRPGNKRFRKIVCEHIPEYIAARSKLDKSMVLNRIIDRVRQQNNGTARFLKNNKKQGGWFEIGNEKAREKVGHAIREAIAAGRNSIETEQRPENCETAQLVAKHQNNLLAQQQQSFAQLLEKLAGGNISSAATPTAPMSMRSNDKDSKNAFAQH